MFDRPGNLIALSGMHVATAGAALLTLMIAAGSVWPQAASPPSLGVQEPGQQTAPRQGDPAPSRRRLLADRKSTRLNSSHANISYAVFCLKKKKSCAYTMPCR